MNGAIQFTPRDVAVYFAHRAPRVRQTNRKEWRGPCPVHDGKDDNFAVDPENGRAFCHSTCGRGWDIIGLERELTGASFHEAKRAVFNLLGRTDWRSPWS